MKARACRRQTPTEAGQSNILFEGIENILTGAVIFCLRDESRIFGIIKLFEACL